MLTKRDIDQIKALASARHRGEQRLFVAEGLRLVQDMLGAFRCPLLVVSERYYSDIAERLGHLSSPMRPLRLEVLPDSFAFDRISLQRTPQPILALFAQPDSDQELPAPSTTGLMLMLDRVQDPGNMGTIMRTADWFGLKHILLTDGCADPYAPKVVQSTMGALARIKVHKLGNDGSEYLARYEGEILGTLLHGESIYATDLRIPSAILVMGNEGNGISSEVRSHLTRALTIPLFASEGPGSESLNVAIATAICLSEFRRQTL